MRVRRLSETRFVLKSVNKDRARYFEGVERTSKPGTLIPLLPLFVTKPKHMQAPEATLPAARLHSAQRLFPTPPLCDHIRGASSHKSPHSIPTTASKLHSTELAKIFPPLFSIANVPSNPKWDQGATTA